MKQVWSRTVVLMVILMMAFSFSSLAASKPQSKGKHAALKGPNVVYRAMAYSFPDETARPGIVETIGQTRVPIGSISYASGPLSPGVIFGNTWYEHQQNGSMGRMIEVGPHVSGSGYAIVHMGWMYLPDKQALGEYRTYAYAAYRSADHTLLAPVYLQTEGEEYGGYVNVDASLDNRAVVGGHNDQGDGFQPHFYFDGGPGFGTFPNEERIPDSTAGYDQISGFEACWPKFFFQYGTDTVFHALAQISGPEAQWAIMYYRKVGFEGSPDYEWDYPPYVVDSVPTMAHDIIGQKLGDRVAMAWTATLPYGEPTCDTCSGLSVYNGFLVGEMDNDVYYQQSSDQGASWQPRVNLTKVPIGEAGYKAYADLTMLYDSQDNLHIVWPACPWPADLCWDEGGFCFTEDWFLDNARLFHWSENVPYIRAIASQVYYPDPEHYWVDSCGSGAWSLRITKPTLSECNGRLYVIWAQFNDPGRGLVDDCAAWGLDESYAAGAANGDIYYSGSADWGMTWSFYYNLTNSYSAGCDPKFTEDCDSDNWPSMNRLGRMKDPMEDWSQSVVVDPSGGAYGNDYYLDIMYVNDADAGAVIFGEGSWTDSPMKWFRIPCTELPVAIPCPVVHPWSIGPPFHIMEGESYDTALYIENLSNSDIAYTVTVEEDNGPAGWLAVSGLDGMVEWGLYNVDTGTIHLNQNGIITTGGTYWGRIIIDFPAVPCTDTTEIELWVFDVPPPPVWWDTLSTSCLSLTINNVANMGNGGKGRVNMDYYDAGDCDTTANIYMYDGSPFIGRIDGDDTLFSWSIYGTSYWDVEAFRSVRSPIPVKYCDDLDAEVYQTGYFVDQDSMYAAEKIWLAPQSDCNFIIQYMRVWSWDGIAHNDLMIGEAIDWDVPWDYLAADTFQTNWCVNFAGLDGARKLLYQQGYEAYGEGSDTLYPFNCQYNDARFAGNAFIESYLNGSQRATYPYSGLVGELDVIQVTKGFDKGLLYQEMILSGLRVTDSLEDLATFMCYEPELDLGADDVYEVVVVLATIQEGTLADFQAIIDDAVAWYNANGGMSMFADDNSDGQIDICQGCCVTMGKFYNTGGPFTILDLDDWIEWLLRNPGVLPGPDCPAQLDIVDSSVCVWAGNMCIYPDGLVDILDLDAWIECLLRNPLIECPSTCPEGY